jgi:hypothetical protein
MTESIPNNPEISEEQYRRNNRAAKLAYSIQELTEMLSDKLWNDPELDNIKDRCFLMATIDACNAAAGELSELVG